MQFERAASAGGSNGQEHCFIHQQERLKNEGKGGIFQDLKAPPEAFNFH